MPAPPNIPDVHIDEDDMYDDPGGTTQKLLSGRVDDDAMFAPKLATELPISNAMSIQRNSFSSFILNVGYFQGKIRDPTSVAQEETSKWKK